MSKRMYRLLVADDEYWIREKLRTMICWKEYQIEFLEPTENGEKALQILAQETVDILITDINMPFVNGVELVKIIKEKYPEVVVFVISGYDDFKYVRETLLSGAIHYLLKPVSKVDLVSAVSRALEIISNKEENERQVLKDASLIQDREMSILLEKNETLFTQNIVFSQNSDFVGHSVLLIKIHEMKDLMSRYEYDLNYLSYSVKHQLRIETEQENLLIFNYLYRSNEFIVISEMEQAEQEKFGRKVMECLKKMTISPITIAVSEHSYSLDSIHLAYTQSVSILMTRMFDRQDRILFSKSEEKNMAMQISNKISPEYEYQLKVLLLAGNVRHLRDFFITQIGIAKCTSWELLEVKQTMKRISSVFMDQILLSGEKRTLLEMEKLDQMMDKEIERLDPDCLINILDEMLFVVCTEKKSEITGNVRDIVRKAAEYIDKNYFEELTLQTLSEKYAIESSYFSRVFKQETGENLMLYIAEKRIEKAKEYMVQDFSITEISFMVGYDDYTYFNKVFRKIVGKSPRDYRSMLGETVKDI